MKKWLAIFLFCTLATSAVAEQVVRYQANREGLHKCVVRITCGNSAGTGTVVDLQGNQVVITAAHVVGDGTQVTVFDGTRRINGEVVGKDRNNDVAVIAARDLYMLDVVAAPLLDRPARVGEDVQHCGYARGKLESTKGVVLAGSDSRTRCTGEAISGDSGSPFFIDGKCAGIVTDKTTYSVPVQQGLFGRVRYSQPQPAFVGTASLIITAIIYAKPIIIKVIELYKAWRAFRQRVWSGKQQCQPVQPDEAPEAPPIPDEPPPTVEAKPETNNASAWWIAYGPGLLILFVLVCVLATPFITAKQGV